MRRLPTLPRRRHARGREGIDHGLYASRQELHPAGRPRQGHRRRQVRRGLPCRRHGVPQDLPLADASCQGQGDRRRGRQEDARRGGRAAPERAQAAQGRRSRDPDLLPGVRGPAHPRRRGEDRTAGGGRDPSGQGRPRTASLRHRPAREPQAGRAERPGRRQRRQPARRQAAADQVDRQGLRQGRRRHPADGQAGDRVELRRPGGRLRQVEGRGRGVLRQRGQRASRDGAALRRRLLGRRQVPCLGLDPVLVLRGAEPREVYRHQADRPQPGQRVLRRRVRRQGLFLPVDGPAGADVEEAQRTPRADADQPRGRVHQRLRAGRVPGLGQDRLRRRRTGAGARQLYRAGQRLHRRVLGFPEFRHGVVGDPAARGDAVPRHPGAHQHPAEGGAARPGREPDRQHPGADPRQGGARARHRPAGAASRQRAGRRAERQDRTQTGAAHQRLPQGGAGAGGGEVGLCREDQEDRQAGQRQDQVGRYRPSLSRRRL